MNISKVYLDKLMNFLSSLAYKLTKDFDRGREKRDIIKDSFDSQVYAPMTRIGVYLDAGSEQYTVKSQYNSTLNGMNVQHQCIK